MMTEMKGDLIRRSAGLDLRATRIVLNELIDSSADNDELERNGENILVCLRRAESHANSADTDVATEMAELFVKAVQLFARYLGYRAEFELREMWGRRALAVAVQMGDLDAEAQLCASVIAWPLLQCGKLEDCEQYCKRGLAAARKINSRRWEGEAARSLSGIARDRFDGDEAMRWALLADTCADHAGLASMKQGAALDRGYAFLIQGKYTDAERYLRAALKMAENDPERFPARCGDLAFALLSLGRLDEAHALFQEAYALAEKVGSRIMIAEGMFNFGKVAELQHRHHEAREWRERAQLGFTKLGIIRKSRVDQFCARTP